MKQPQRRLQGRACAATRRCCQGMNASDAAPQVVGLIGGLGLQWQASFGIITVLYFYSHYMFASGAAHIGAMYTAFLSVRHPERSSFQN